MGLKSGRNGTPVPQSRVSLSELKPREEFCLLECVRSFLLVVLRIRSRPFSTDVCSRAFLFARLARATKSCARMVTEVWSHRVGPLCGQRSKKQRGRLCRRFRNSYEWD